MLCKGACKVQPAAGTTAAVVDKTELQSQNPSTNAPVKGEGGGGEHESRERNEGCHICKVKLLG